MVKISRLLTERQPRKLVEDVIVNGKPIEAPDVVEPSSH